jgi:hypothetical protein
LAELTRKQDWPESLAAAIEQAREQPFAWGEHDCALWCADVILAMTGADLASDLRGRYDSPEGAQAVIESLGLPKLEALLNARLLAIPIEQVQRGDLVLHENGAAGICDGFASWFVTPEGLTRLKTSHFEKAWRV